MLAVQWVSVCAAGCEDTILEGVCGGSGAFSLFYA